MNGKPLLNVTAKAYQPCKTISEGPQFSPRIRLRQLRLTNTLINRLAGYQSHLPPTSISSTLLPFLSILSHTHTHTHYSHVHSPHSHTLTLTHTPSLTHAQSRALRALRRARCWPARCGRTATSSCCAPPANFSLRSAAATAYLLSSFSLYPLISLLVCGPRSLLHLRAGLPLPGL